MVTGVILAGGQNRRMDGQIKALLPFRGETLLERQIKEMKLICDELFLVTNQPEQFSLLIEEEIQMVVDEIPFMGPLGGMHAAFTRANHDHVWVVGCDMPFISSRIARTLVDCRGRLNCDAVVPFIGGQIHPLHGVYSKECGHVMMELLQKDIRQVKHFLQRIKWKAKDELFFMERGFDLRFVTNVNTPEEYEKALKEEGTLE